MWEGSSGRDTVFPWGDASEPGEPETTYAVGDAVYSGDCRGTVVAVSLDGDTPTMGVKWSDGDGAAIIYPMDADYLRKGMPWE